jgi:hypothetical protein
VYLLFADESGTHGSSHALCLDEAYRRIATFKPYDQNLPVALFGVVLDRNFHSSWSVIERERFAYEVMLNKFDVMLKRLRSAGTSLNRDLSFTIGGWLRSEISRSGRGNGRRPQEQ